MRIVELSDMELIDIRRFLSEMIEIRRNTIDELQKLERFDDKQWAKDYADLERRDIEICKAFLEKFHY